MYVLADRLDPDRYLALARAVYAEMALAGITAVGEFHYLHHHRSGRRYSDPNAMGHALVQAAADAGIRLTLLDACYLAGGLGPDGPLPLDEVQKRFSDGDVERWASRVASLRLPQHARSGAAIHSVRAVPVAALAQVATASSGRPLHVHVSEQPAENVACLEAYGLTPAALLGEQGVLGTATTAVHATHLTDADVELVGSRSTSVCVCPTTERDLADGIGPSRRLADAGSPICLGTDQHAVVDLLDEARSLEMDERLSSGERNRFTQVELLAALTTAGHRCLGWADAGEIRPRARADLVEVRLDTVRTAGTDPAQALMWATAADIDTVVVDGQVVVEDACHVLGDVGALLAGAIEPLWADL
jgi:formiminoglutamate deiminase